MLMMQSSFIANMGCYSSTHLTRISTPRFLGKKRGKGLQRSSTMFTSSPWSSFLNIRGNNSRKMDILEDRVFHGQLMETGFHKHILSWQTWNTWKCEKEWESFKFDMPSCEYIWVVLANHIEEDHWMCNIVVGREGSNIVCFSFLKHGFSCRYSMYRTLFYDISISLLKTVIEHF
jgi:hypothetical protein